VEYLTWTDSQNFCVATGMRLPTEAEWEYAARAGSTGSRYGDIDSIAWHYGNSNGKTHEVGQKQPNEWGLYDMLGNVWQWTADWYADQYSGNNETDPKGPSSGQYRALRGGSWDLLSKGVRVSYRVFSFPRDYGVGFRCAGY
jgi:formylglycine-generating enzyme required for sulfatase activity